MQDGQAEISLSLAVSLTIIEHGADSYKPRQFRGMLMLFDESGEMVGPIQKLQGVLKTD